MGRPCRGVRGSRAPDAGAGPRHGAGRRRCIVLVAGRASADRGGRRAACSATLSDTEFSALKAHYDDAKILEVILLCGFYRTVSYLANGLALPLEENAAKFPK